MVNFSSMTWELVIQSPNTERTEFNVKPGKTTLGRKSQNDIVITDDAASRYHAVIELDNAANRLVISDSGSTNGTYVNGKQIFKPHPLEHNDQVRIGLHLITVISKDWSHAEDQKAIHTERPGDYNNLLIHSIDNYSALLLDLSKHLSKVQSLREAQSEIARFVGRMINADKCGVVLVEKYNDLIEEFGSRAIIDRVTESQSPILISGVSDAADKAMVREDIASLVLSPVFIDQEMVALIYAIKHDKAARAFEENDLLLIVSVSHHTAMTIQRLKYEQALLQSANHDLLTGLPNRKLLLERLSRAIARAKRSQGYGFALFFIDVNNFKLINDSLGHALGDQMLREIGRRLKSNFRELDTVARFGGDEFAILYEGVRGVQDVVVAAKRLINNTSEPYTISGQEFVLSLSIGVTLSSTGYDFAEDVLRDADIAMYKAKEEEEGSFKVYDQEMHAQLMSSLKLQTEVRNAYKLKELLLQYQPIIALETGQMVGLEALIRWNSSERGLLKPDQFFSSFNTTGILSSVEKWVVRTGCEQIARLNKQFNRPLPLFISVNLSNKQLENPNLVDLIDQALAKYEIKPEQLWLEISEKTSFTNEESAIALLHAIHTRGVRLCLDDFGTGYSTLKYLSHLPIDILKVDRSLISDLDANLESRKIVQTVIGLANNLGLNLVAEGVETQAQLDFLKTSKCNYAQGYYFSEPLYPEQIIKLMEQDRSYLEPLSA
jgi:diguanylate cyclase (GGDEF)-like protein